METPTLLNVRFLPFFCLHFFGYGEVEFSTETGVLDGLGECPHARLVSTSIMARVFRSFPGGK